MKLQKIINFRTEFSSGFTLVEMILSLGILSILIGVLSGIFGSIIDTQLSSKALSSVDQDGRYIIAKLNYNMLNSSSIVSPAVPGSSTSAVLKNSADSVDYTYSLNNGNLLVSSTAGSVSLNSIDTTISDLTFKRVGLGDMNDTLQINFTVNSKTVLRGQPNKQTFQTTFGLQ